MFELARHIEILLLDNDCVIIPDFGGFVAHYSSAEWNENEGVFLPPMRMIGFNPQLKLNDGLLVQSYMKVYDTSFSDASKILENQTAALILQIEEESKVEFPNVGEVLYSLQGTYTFLPYDNKMTSPLLYGLNTFELPELDKIYFTETIAEKRIVIADPASSIAGRRLKINPALFHNIAGSAAVAIIAILLFFISSPLDTIYVDNGNYAQLLPSGMIEQLDKHSLLTTRVRLNTTNAVATPEVKEIAEQLTENIIEMSQPDNEANKITEVISQELTPSFNTKRTPFNLIVASVLRQSDADKIITQLKSQGYNDAKVIKGNGKIRVCIMSFDNRQEAEQQLTQLRQKDSFNNSWLLIK